MKNTVVTILILLYLSAFTVNADSIRHISSREGLTNNAVLSLHQDREGFIWIGTCEGLNRWNGMQIEPFPLAGTSSALCSGNLIEKITRTGDNAYWIRTNYGLDLMRENVICEHHQEFFGLYYYVSTTPQNTIVLTQNEELFGYDANECNFKQINLPSEISYRDYLSAVSADDDSRVWLLTRKGVFSCHLVSSEDGVCTIERLDKIISGSFVYAHSSVAEAFMISEEGRLFVFDCSSGLLNYRTSIDKEIEKRGSVSSIIRDGDDFIVSFLLNGVIRLRYRSHLPDKYEVVPFDINCGVFCLLKDAYQDIIWMGTDGQGVITYSKDNLSFRSYHYRNFPEKISKPIRALYLDDNSTLWTGTKGEGIVLIREFRSGGVLSASNVKRLALPGKNRLSAVYSFMKSSDGGIWIGSEEQGIFYCPKNSERIEKVSGAIPPELKYIHDMEEDVDGSIWVATVGRGVYHLYVDYSGGHPEITTWEKLDFGDALQGKNYFFTLHRAEDGSIWFGNRGGGLVHYYPTDKSFDILRFDSSDNPLANDIWDIFEDSEKTLWLGTSDGLIRYDGKSIDSPANLHCIVHQVIGSPQGALWLTTNTGLIRFNPLSGDLVRYGYDYGLETIEFCDGASFYDPISENILVGGVDGIVTIGESADETRHFHPSVELRGCVVNGEAVRLSSVLHPDGTIRIPRGSVLNSLTFYALDYLDGSNYCYQVKMDARTYDGWQETLPELKFSLLKHGSHTVSIRYRNAITGYISPAVTYKVLNPAPIFRSAGALALYALLLSGAMGRFLVVRRKKQRIAALEISRQLELRRKEEAASTQIHLLENMARQFSLPLSMISIPASQLRDYRGGDDTVRRLSDSILHQSDQLGEMLRMMQDFGESSNDQQSVFPAKLFQVKELIERIITSNEVDARSNQVRICFEHKGTDIWYSSPKGVASIVDISLSVAINHASPGSDIRFILDTEGDKLVVETLASGIWLSKEDATALFDRVSVMNYFLRKSHAGDAFQDEMRLALCANTSTRLGGTFRYYTLSDGFRICVALPKIESDSRTQNLDAQDNDSEPFIEDRSRKTMLIVGKNNEIVSSIAGYFRKEFLIRFGLDAKEGISGTQDQIPDIVIFEDTAYTMTSTDVIRKFKSDKRTAHVPVILITSMEYHRTEEDDSPWDVLMTLPLNIRSLHDAVNQSIKLLDSLKDYYSSAVSVYEFIGNNALHQDDKAFLGKMFRIIADNISDISLNTEFVAKEMGMSVRNLYHKLDTLVVSTPRNIILDYRLSYSEQLLTRTKLTIEEILFRSGFANRGTYFRNFSSKYGMTPRAYRIEWEKSAKSKK